MKRAAFKVGASLLAVLAGLLMTYVCGVLGNAAWSPADWSAEFRAPLAVFGVLMSAGFGCVVFGYLGGA